MWEQMFSNYCRNLKYSHCFEGALSIFFFTLKGFTLKESITLELFKMMHRNTVENKQAS